MPATNRIYPPPFPSFPSSFSIASHRSSIQIASPLGLLNLWYARCARVTRPRPCICSPDSKGPKDQRETDLSTLFHRSLLSHPLTQTLSSVSLPFSLPLFRPASLLAGNKSLPRLSVTPEDIAFLS